MTRLVVPGLERDRLRAIVRREVVRLMELALSTDDEVLRDAAVRHAVILCGRTRTRMPRAYAKLICRRCLSLYRFSGGSRFRVRSGRGKRVVVTCGRCGALNRIPVEP
jgi:RNase P subunit RPR2